MGESRRSRPVVLAATAALTAGVLAVAAAPAPASAGTPVWRIPRPESTPPPDAPGAGVRDGRAGRLVLASDDTRTIAERLAVAGADPALGANVSAVVIDTTTGEAVYSRGAGTALMPASNEKLVTAFVALTTLGPNRTFPTVAKVDTARSTLWLRGGGDPALSTSQLRTLAQQVRTDVVAAGRSAITVKVDDSLFPAPTNAPGWKTSYVPGEVAPVRALVVDGRNVVDTSLDTGNVFASELRRLGIAVPSVSRGTLSRGGTTVASVTSPPVAALVATMVNTSSNDYAEVLHRQSSLVAGTGGTWEAARAHATGVLAAHGVDTAGIAVHDGSGLSRSDRQSAASFTGLLMAARRSFVTRHVLYRDGAMPVAGVSGTLRTRFASPDTTCARGLVRAKTGWLSDAVALSGTAYGVDGTQRVFSIVENGAASPTEARLAIERFATAATGCNPD